MGDNVVKIQKVIVFLFVMILLLYMVKMAWFTRKKWEFKTYTFGVLILGLSILSLGTFIDMMVDLINFDYKYVVIKVCFSIGAVIFIIGVIVWSNYTKEMIQRFEEVALTDNLTGAFNRNGIEKVFTKIIKNNNQFFVIICDLNKTKIINDNYGHIYGDEYIKEAARIISEVIKNNGHLGRIGGDEFVMLIEYEDNIKLNNRLSNIKKMVSEIFTDDRIGISIGHSLFPDDGKTLNELILVADKKMYEDKLDKLNTL